MTNICVSLTSNFCVSSPGIAMNCPSSIVCWFWFGTIAVLLLTVALCIVVMVYVIRLVQQERIFDSINVEYWTGSEKNNGAYVSISSRKVNDVMKTAINNDVLASILKKAGVGVSKNKKLGSKGS